MSKYRETAGLSQEALGNAMGYDKRQVGWWERCEDGSGKLLSQGIYTQLAKALGNVSAEQLAKEHKLDLERKRARETKVCTKLLQQSLEACVGGNFIGRVCEQTHTPDIAAATKAIISLLKEGKLDGLRKALNRPLDEVLRQIGEQVGLGDEGRSQSAQLQSLRGVVCAIAVTSLVPPKEWSRGGTFTVQGAAGAWVVRLAVDRALGYSMTYTRARDEWRLDDSTTRSLTDSGNSTATDEDEQVWELIKHFAEMLHPTQPPPPHPNIDPSGFIDYCNRFDAVLADDNDLQEHAFILLQQAEKKLLNRLNRLLKSLRLFVCEDHGDGPAWVLLDQTELETWLAKWLYRIDRATEPLGSPSTPKIDEKEHTVPQIIVNNVQNQGDTRNHSADAHNSLSRPTSP
ncbi:MAG: helix-turn-helix transcriptional regulator [Sedimenticola sp.]